VVVIRTALMALSDFGVNLLGMATHKWQDRTIAHPDDAHDLERRAAVLEMIYRLPKHDAEQRAHDEYRVEQHKKGAAFHLAGSRAAASAGDSEQARKHSVCYALHCKAFGHNPEGPVNPEVQALVGRPESRFYKFKPSRHDQLLLTP